jgi:hypothetical protein
MALARHGNPHSLHQEVLQRLVEKRTMPGRRDLYLQNRFLLMNFGTGAVSISEATAPVPHIEKASCPIPPAVMSLQHLEAITSHNVTNQVLLPICLPEIRLRLWTMLAQTL